MIQTGHGMGGAPVGLARLDQAAGEGEPVVCAKRAENLAADVSYVRGWRTQRAAEELAGQLRAVGLEADFVGLMADVNVDGDGLVCLGVVRPKAAELLTMMLISGLTAEMAEQAASGVDPPPAAPAA